MRRDYRVVVHCFFWGLYACIGLNEGNQYTLYIISGEKTNDKKLMMKAKSRLRNTLSILSDAVDSATTDATATTNVEDATQSPRAVPPLEAAALRLEKLLKGQAEDALSAYFSNPAKVVGRWFSTSSGAVPRHGSIRKGVISPCC